MLWFVYYFTMKMKYFNECICVYKVLIPHTHILEVYSGCNIATFGESPILLYGTPNSKKKKNIHVQITIPEQGKTSIPTHAQIQMLNI